MRLGVLDHGHRGRSRLFVWMLNRLAGGEGDVLKMMHHRPEFFGREAFTQASGGVAEISSSTAPTLP